jgi:hypothetical protein
MRGQNRRITVTAAQSMHCRVIRPMPMGRTLVNSAMGGLFRPAKNSSIYFKFNT